MAGKGIERRLAEVRAKIKQLNSVITADVNKFNAAIQEFVRLKTEEEALLIVREAVAKAFVRIVDRTPVDTGRARASWQFGINSNPDGEAAEGDYPEFKVEGEEAIERAVAETLSEIRAAPAAVWYIANHLDYIEALEAGWSKQAPAGMVSLTLRELARQLEGVKI